MYDEDFRLSTFNLGNWLKSVVLGRVVACSAKMRGDLGSILGGASKILQLEGNTRSGNLHFLWAETVFFKTLTPARI